LISAGGFTPDPLGGAHSALPDSPAGLKGSYFSGKGRGKGKRGRGRKEKGK